MLGKALFRRLSSGGAQGFVARLREAPHVSRLLERAAPHPAEAPVAPEEEEETYDGGRDAAGRRDGRGRCVAAAYEYDGGWRDDAAHGDGVLTTADFSYAGDFGEGAFHGRGAWKRRDGSRSYGGRAEKTPS